MALFAVMDRDSGLFLGAGRHPSYIEFEDLLPPRLFSTASGAHAALRNWRQGHWVTRNEWESTDEYGSGFYVQGLPVPRDDESNRKLQIKRASKNVAVVEITLTTKPL